MFIKRLYVKNFRNIKSEQWFEFDKNINVFVGDNAQGKTNLMEAISLCIGPSFRNGKFTKIIPIGLDNTKEKVLIKLWFVSDNTERENLIEYTICNNKREILYNKIQMKTAMQLYGLLKYVVFIPEHLDLIKGSPELRRDYLDSVALMQTSVHLKKLSRYNKTLKNKNNLLANSNQNSDIEMLKAQLETWNTILAQEGINVSYGRLKYFDQLKEIANKLYSELSGKNEQLTMEYYSSIFDTVSLKLDDVNTLYNEYLKRLTNSFNQELKNHYTFLGVHRDDINFYINNNNVKDFGSQGQKRSVALVLKLAEAEIIRIKNKETPVVILDDVLSELDGNRRGFILNNIVNSQVFITCCNIEDVSKFTEGKKWHVDDGEFIEF